MHGTKAIKLDESELQFKFIRSPGPGGQHVNKAATAVQLRFDVRHSKILSDNARLRLLKFAKNRISTDGVLIINANRFRSQDLNRKDALARLHAIIEQSLRRQKPRRRTKPTIGSVKKRIENKKRCSKLKHSRKPVTRNEL